MQIPCYKLKHALELVEPAIARKPTLPITQNFLIQDGRVMATNLEMAIAADLPEAKGESLCLPYGVVSKFIQYIPNTDILEISIDGTKATIRAGRMSSTVHGADPKDFPPFPYITPDGAGSVDGDRLVNALMGAVPATARDESRPILTGVCLTFGDPIELAGADGFRLIWYEAPIKLEAPDGGPKSICIPRTSVLALEKVWKKAIKPPASGGGPSSEGFSGLAAKPALEAARMAIAKRMALVQYSAKENRMQLNFGEATFTTQLLVGEFPNYRQLIPENLPHKVAFDAAEAYRAVRMLSGMAKDGSGIIRMSWEGDAIEFSARAAEVGDIAQAIPATVRGPSGEGGKIAFNSRYLLEYLEKKEGLVLLEATSPSSPGRFTHGRSPHCLVMPMFVNDEEGEPSDKAAAPTPEEINAELAQAADEGEPVADSHGLPVTSEASSAEEKPAEDRGEPANPTKPRRKSRRQAPSTS